MAACATRYPVPSDTLPSYMDPRLRNEQRQFSARHPRRLEVRGRQGTRVDTIRPITTVPDGRGVDTRWLRINIRMPADQAERLLTHLYGPPSQT